eukprot:scaffold5.g1009.t1
MRARWAFLAVTLCAVGTAAGARLGGEATSALAVGMAEPATGGSTVDKAPWFCHSLDCPEYTVLASEPEFEVRVYEKGVWASTDVLSWAYMLAATTGFRRLFAYISGANEQGAKIPMTAPVATSIQASQGPFCRSNFTVSFFVPFASQADPPEPSSPDVYIQRSPAFIAFVGQSGGLAMDDFTIAKMAGKVTAALDDLGLKGDYVEDHYFVAGYDPPFRLTGRHSEVWILAKPAFTPERAAALAGRGQ